MIMIEIIKTVEILLLIVIAVLSYIRSSKNHDRLNKIKYRMDVMCDIIRELQDETVEDTSDLLDDIEELRDQLVEQNETAEDLLDDIEELRDQIAAQEDDVFSTVKGAVKKAVKKIKKNF